MTHIQMRIQYMIDELRDMGLAEECSVTLDDGEIRMQSPTESYIVWATDVTEETVNQKTCDIVEAFNIGSL